MNKTEKVKQLPVIGWREWVELPDLGCGKIKVKVDSGARSSSLHAFNIEAFEKDGQAWVRFEVHPKQHSRKPVISTEAKVLEYRHVKNSGGKATKRPVIETNISLLGRTWPVELTLANRDNMGFRMLLGRQAIRGKMLIDTGGSFYGGKPTITKKKKNKK